MGVPGVDGDLLLGALVEHRADDLPPHREEPRRVDDEGAVQVLRVIGGAQPERFREQLQPAHVHL